MSDIPFGIPDGAYEQAKLLEEALVDACEGKTSGTYDYEEVRKLFMKDPAIRPLLPEFVRTCRDLGHFWGYIKQQSPQWAPRRYHVREALTPLFNHLEGMHRAPVDSVVSSTLLKFDANGVHAVWQKALERLAYRPRGRDHQRPDAARNGLQTRARRN